MELIEQALKKKLGISIPFMDEIFEYILISNQNFSRSSFLFNCAGIFGKPDQKILEIGVTLEFLFAATSLHRKINEFENSRRQQKYVKNILGSEASVLIGDYLLSASFKILTDLKNLNVLECISLATKNISRGQVMEISEPTLLSDPNYCYKVIKYKIAGLYGAAAKSAAYWGDASQESASKLFSFGEHFGIAIQIKKSIESIKNKKIIYQKLKDQEVWYPFSVLIHDCLKHRERIEIFKKLKIDFDVMEMSEEIFGLFKTFDLETILREKAFKELKKAEHFLYELEIETTKIKSLINFPNI